MRKYWLTIRHTEGIVSTYSHEEFNAFDNKDALRKAKEIVKHKTSISFASLDNVTDKANEYSVAQLVKGCVWKYTR